MPGLSFQRRFGKAVENGVAIIRGEPVPWPGVEPKFQTIRAPRVHPIREGQTLSLWECQRTPDRRRLGTVKCLLSIPIQIHTEDEVRPAKRRLLAGQSLRYPANHIRVTWTHGSPYGLDELARRDGFSSLDEMLKFLAATHARSFIGFLHSWDPTRPWEK